jgi:RNA polymerase sigma-70 factor, ECF subfamily
MTVLALESEHPPAKPVARSGGGLESFDNDNDVRLIAAMCRGDRDALASLYDRYATLLLAVATRMLGERREAEDLVHDVMLEVWRQAADYDTTRGTVRAWILVRLRSRALDRKKSVGATRVIAVDPERLHQETDDRVEDPAFGPDRAAVRRALMALPEDQRTVLELGYFEGLSSSEIAARIDAPVGTVKSRVAAALAKLRAGLGETSPGGAR